MEGLPTWNLALAAAAGIATIASPCVLPVLPLLLGAGSSGSAAAAGERWRPLALVGGFVLGFVALALLFGASAQVLGIPAERVRQAGALLLLLAGVAMAWPALGERLFAPAARWAEALQQRLPARPDGLLGTALLGLALGVVWAPCAGPVLAAILGLLAGAERSEAAPLLTAYALGAGLPMLAIVGGARWALERLRPVARHAVRIRRGLGALVIATAAAMLAQVDTQAAAWLAQQASSVAAGLRSPFVPPSVEIEARDAPQFGAPAPELAGLDAWLNTPGGAPLTIDSLRGRVVLLDFWTFGCINCVRTLPHLRQWHQRYAERGLVVLGVHTPEFAHERPLAALEAAVRRHALRYPIAQDNGFKTWKAYGVQAWPTQVLIDRQGRIALRHIGEGDEAAIERRIEQLLDSPP
ncbi:redoxin domain-containing protein [Aquincola sp. S2]|uniref:Redoxin domain-containing protein n=1 Tax=Pseudaquabacterium terrae TaxID=2732868 RepID=A0ABX2EQX6_9BURK|nr:cytochrome c biogenesis protein CcdA [Aquabacterium terrae]NRF70942.1 redoxin domain-containing protein [Aquabacterium terrae]